MTEPKARIVAADPDPDALASLARALQEEGMLVDIVTGAEELFAALQEESADLVIAARELDAQAQGDLLEQLRGIDPDLVVILTSAFSTVADALDAIKRGASDYLNKPLVEEEAHLSVRKALEKSTLARRFRTLQRQLEDHYGFDQFLVRDRSMKEVLVLADAVADSRATLLLTGESGTGKTLLARSIHQKSPRREGPFVEVNCGALPENLLESELFGHVRGAFTGAVRDKMGKIELASGGTLFLDEIATATPTLQVKLLRVLQDRTFERVGGEERITADVRLILATNVDLHLAVREGNFREDLFYRINVVNLEIPPLRKRTDDILFLAHHFLHKYAEEYGRPAAQISPQAVSLLLGWLWPGNVRELENTMERAVVLTRDRVVEPDNLPPWIRDAWRESHEAGEERAPAGTFPEPPARAAPPVPDRASRAEQTIPPLKDSLKLAEKEFILQALEACGWNRSRTARLLRIDRSTLFHKMRRHGLQPARGGGEGRGGEST